MNIVTPFDMVNHFLAQGIIFTSDRVLSKNSKDLVTPTNHTVTNANKFAEFYAEMCL